MLGRHPALRGELVDHPRQKLRELRQQVGTVHSGLLRELVNRLGTERRAEIESEIADVAILLFELADNCRIDLAAAMRAKLARNDERYPVDKARGSNKKYNEL